MIAERPDGKSLLPICTLAASAREGTCAWCAAELPARRRTWCSDRCGDAFWTNHWWTLARGAAKRRDKYRCIQCGHKPPTRPSKKTAGSHATYLAAMRAWRKTKRTDRLEINHIVPCNGSHGILSCSHHLENLETLCVSCHRVHTSAIVRSP